MRIIGKRSVFNDASGIIIIVIAQRQFAAVVVAKSDRSSSVGGAGTDDVCAFTPFKFGKKFRVRENRERYNRVDISYYNGGARARNNN